MTVDGHALKLSNLDKVFWKNEGYTKLDLINYYAEVAPVLLPHLRDRPLSLHRHPDGADGKSFFQKNTEGLAPAWAQTILLEGENGGPVRYLVGRDRATLLFVANLGCIEIHPWLSRVSHLNRPDFLVLDLDPLDVPFSAVVEVALAAKGVLDELGLGGYPKTSGATGIHIYLPFSGRYDYAQARHFGEVLALRLHARLPHLTSVERLPAHRRGRVYLDWLQNGEGKTVVAPYSLRPGPEAPVSTPLRWEELTPDLRPEQFTLRTLPARLRKVGDLFAPVLGEGLDLSPLARAA